MVGRSAKDGKTKGEQGERRMIGKGEREPSTGRCAAVQYSSARGVEMILSACRNCRGTSVF